MSECNLVLCITTQVASPIEVNGKTPADVKRARISSFGWNCEEMQGFLPAVFNTLYLTWEDHFY